MSLALNFHPDKGMAISAVAKTFDGPGTTGFVTLTVQSGSDDVTFFIKDNADALAILNAASALVAQMYALTASKAVIDPEAEAMSAADDADGEAYFDAYKFAD